MAGTSARSLRSENERLCSEVEELRIRLDEAEQALEAIRMSQAEALVIEGPNGPRIFSLEGADHAYRVLVEAMNEGAATFGEDGTVLYCNARFAEMLDAPLERVMGGAIGRFVSERSRPAFDALVRQAKGGESRGELEIRNQTGKLVPAYVSVSVIDDETPRRCCLVATDLRAQKRNEEILAAERLAGSVLEQAADAIVFCDENGRIIRASSSAVDLCASNPLLASFEQALPLELPAGDAGGSPENLLAKAMRGELLRAVPASLTLRDGTRADLLASATSLRGSDDLILGYVVTLVDVTDLRRTEAALRKALADAEERGRLLEEADRRKNDFLAALSHELRNPLAPISNSLYVLDRAAPGGAQAKRAKDIIDRQVAHLSRLVNDLLDVTRITRNKVQLQRERADLGVIVRRSVEDQRSLFDDSQLKLEVDIPAGPTLVDADTSRISQVIGNLLQNAAKFTSGGGVTRVNVSADEPRGQAVVRVADTGAGMTTETIAGLFEPFVQADHTLDRSGGGLGLGLALVKGLVELHGGEVTAHSDGLGHGAEFVVRLPLEGAADDQAKLAHAAPPPPARILIIEDNVDAAESLREALELSGHEVLVAYNGPDGIAKARDCRPGFVFCDIGLPGMDGYAVARAFRGEEALRNVRLVALSGYALPEDLQRSTEAGFEQHIAKPPSLEALAVILSSAQGQGRS